MTFQRLRLGVFGVQMQWSRVQTHMTQRPLLTTPEDENGERELVPGRIMPPALMDFHARGWLESSPVGLRPGCDEGTVDV